MTVTERDMELMRSQIDLLARRIDVLEELQPAINKQNRLLTDFVQAVEMRTHQNLRDLDDKIAELADQLRTGMEDLDRRLAPIGGGK